MTLSQRVLRRFVARTDPFQDIMETVSKFIDIADGMPSKLRELSAVLEAPVLGKWSILLDGRLKYLQNDLLPSLTEARALSQLLSRKIDLLSTTPQVSELDEYKKLESFVETIDREFDKANTKYGIGWDIDEYVGSRSGIYKTLEKMMDAERELEEVGTLESALEDTFSDYA